MPGARVVVVDHYDSYTWNLVHLVAAVTGTLPTVVEHDQVAAEDLRSFSHVLLSPGPGTPTDPADFALGRAVFEIDRPVLGVCLGMQLLFDSSVENEGASGLSLLEGVVGPLEANGYKVPHIGWSPVRWEHPSALTEGLGDESPFYFVHSFAPRPTSEDDVLGTAAYGERFACAVERPRLYGVQFHPEKSSSAGLRLLSNFVRICS